MCVCVCACWGVCVGGGEGGGCCIACGPACCAWPPRPNDSPMTPPVLRPPRVGCSARPSLSAVLCTGGRVLGHQFLLAADAQSQPDLRARPRGHDPDASRAPVRGLAHHRIVRHHTGLVQRGRRGGGVSHCGVIRAELPSPPDCTASGTAHSSPCLSQRTTAAVSQRHDSGIAAVTCCQLAR